MLSLWHKIQRRFTLDFWIRRYLLLREKLEGVDFSEVVEVEELGLDPSLASHSAPSGNKYLRNVLNQISISTRDAIIDIGSGKGSAMRIMLEFPFHKVDGIELSSQVAEIAQKNFNKLRIPRNRYELFVMDAANFKALDGYNYFYFYNPFSQTVLEKVIENIVSSIERAPRIVFIIYNNPKYNSVIISERLFNKIAEYPDEWGNKIFLYSNQVGT